MRARRNLLIEGGVRGGAGSHSKLDAGGKLLTPFMERVEARARESIVVDKYCLYCTIYAGSNLVVRQQVYGGVINAYGSVYVGQQLGNKAAVPTQVFLGYDPVSIRQLEKLDKILKDLSQAVTHLNAVAGHLPPETNEITRKLRARRRQYADLLKKREQLWSRLTQDEQAMEGCRLLVPGKVYPGVEISIGRTFMAVERAREAVLFRLKDDEIVVENLPAALRGGLS